MQISFDTFVLHALLCLSDLCWNVCRKIYLQSTLDVRGCWNEDQSGKSRDSEQEGEKIMPDSDAEVPDPTQSSGKGKGKCKRKREEPLSLDDCLCPVCLDLFLEPVTLPCMHTFCKACFLESVDKSTLCCPMCRKRVSTWVRLNNRNKTLVNQQLWTQIQLSFPQHCQRRLGGQDAVSDDDLTVFSPRTSQPGELRQEYQEQINKLSEEKRELEEEEQRASEEYIHKLLAEEEEILQEERKRSEEDEQLAKVLNKELNTAPVSPDNHHRAHITPAKKKVNTAGHIEKFLCRLPSKSSPSECSSTSTLISNKENIRLSHGQHLPQADLYRTQQDQPEPPCPGPASPLEARHCQIRHTDAGTSKRKSSEPANEEDAKRGRLHLPSSSSSALPLEGALVLQAQLEAQLEQRRQQEEADRQMALLLQEKLDQEERQQQTDRRKGTIDAYLLRRVGSDTRRRNSRTSTTSPLSLSTSSSSSSSSSSSEVSTSSSQNDSSRQSTLTDVFSDLGS